MAIPSGSGSEVLKSVYKEALTNSVVKLIDGVANHIYTILTITWCEKGADATNGIDLYVDLAGIDVSGGSGKDIYILNEHNVGSRETFVYSDRFVITGEDELFTRISTSANVDVVCTYIDQSWI